MDYQEKLAFLRSYRAAVRREETLAEEIEALRSQAARMTQALTGLPGGGDGQALPRAVERLLEAQHRLEEQAARTIEARARVGAAIARISDPLHQDILTRRYILGQQWERIAADNHFTLRRVLQIHRSAIDRMEIS